MTLPKILCLVFLLGSTLAISLNAQQPSQPTQSPSDKPAPEPSISPCPEAEALKKNIAVLNIDVQRLKKRVAELEKERLATSLQEQLERGEQRGELLQLHLLEIAGKEEPLQARL